MEGILLVSRKRVLGMQSRPMHEPMSQNPHMLHRIGRSSCSQSIRQRGSPSVGRGIVASMQTSGTTHRM